MPQTPQEKAIHAKNDHDRNKFWIENSYIASTIGGLELTNKQLRSENPEIDQHVRNALKELKLAKSKMHELNDKEFG